MTLHACRVLGCIIDSMSDGVAGVTGVRAMSSIHNDRMQHEKTHADE